jgi:ribosomal protein L12E/L44/L45/RPP1/RPP2
MFSINDETKQALLDALENDDIDEFIRLAETQPTLREPDESNAAPGAGGSE